MSQGMQACQEAIEKSEQAERQFKLALAEAMKSPEVCRDVFQHLLQSGDQAFIAALENVCVLIQEARATRNGDAEHVVELAQKRLDLVMGPVIEEQLRKKS